MPIYTLSDLNKAKSKKPAGPAKQKAVAKPRTPIKLSSNIHTMSSPATKRGAAEKESNMAATNGRTLSSLVPSKRSRSGRKLSRRTLSACDVAEGMQLDAAAAAVVDPFYGPGRTLADVPTDDDDELIDEVEGDLSGDEKKTKTKRLGRKRGKGAKGRKKDAKGKGKEAEKAEQINLEAGTVLMGVEHGLGEAETVIERGS